MKFATDIAVGVTVVALAWGGMGFAIGRGTVDTPKPEPVLLSRPVQESLRHAYDYASQCGGTVSFEPLHGGGSDVVVVGCDR